MPFTNDPVLDAEEYMAQQPQTQYKRPLCAECEMPIQADHLYCINGELVCPECLENYYRKETEDYVE